MITGAAIRSALANAPKSGKSNIELKDGERRGQGRLALIIRVGQPKPPSKTAPVSADWYAVWYRGDRRKMAKIGSYPIMALTEARKHFRADFLPAIARGDEPQGAFARRVKVDGRTVLDLFTAYADNLDAQGKFSGAARAYLLGCDNAPPQRWKGRKTQSAADATGPRCARSSTVTDPR